MKLHVTNGDVTAEMLALHYGDNDQFLVWRDILHDGPVLGHLDRPERDKARVDFLSQFLADSPLALTQAPEDIAKDFKERQEIGLRLSQYDEIILWFEHDLYDQLQLLDVANWLDEFAKPSLENLPPIKLVTCNHFPGILWFDGYGNLSPEQLVSLYPNAILYKQPHHTMALAFWSIFSGQSADRLVDLLSYPDNHLPFMKAAIRRWCREFPSPKTGLSLTQTRLLTALMAPLSDLPRLREHFAFHAEEQGQSLEEAKSHYTQIMEGPMSLGRLFVNLQHLEEAPFLGDLSVMQELVILHALHLITIDPPLSESEAASPMRFSITDLGQRLMESPEKVAPIKIPPRWRGGINIEAQNPIYWDDVALRFTGR